MKSNLQMSASNAASRVYWHSLDELAEGPEFRQWVEKEFPAGASEFTDPVSRRHFVKIMSASFLLAGIGLTGCRRPEEKIFPFAKMPEGYTHGVPQWFATAMPVRGSAIPLVARSNDGRPTKVEGNALHPDSSGGTDRFAQASVLNLYDPDRALRFVKNGSKVSREEAFNFLREMSQSAQANDGAGLCFLVERSNSPSRARLQRLISQRFPKAGWFVYEPVDFDIHRRAATLAFGKPVTPRFHLDEAKVILSLDCDFIGAEENAHRLIRGFSAGRRLANPDDTTNRLYVIESLMTLTGANADHRLRLPQHLIQQATAHLDDTFFVDKPSKALGCEKFGELDETVAKWLMVCLADLQNHKGQSLVIAGQRQPLEVHLTRRSRNQKVDEG